MLITVTVGYAANSARSISGICGPPHMNAAHTRPPADPSSSLPRQNKLAPRKHVLAVILVDRRNLRRIISLSRLQTSPAIRFSDSTASPHDPQPRGQIRCRWPRPASTTSLAQPSLPRPEPIRPRHVETDCKQPLRIVLHLQFIYRHVHRSTPSAPKQPAAPPVLPRTPGCFSSSSRTPGSSDVAHIDQEHVRRVRLHILMHLIHNRPLHQKNHSGSASRLFPAPPAPPKTGFPADTDSPTHGATPKANVTVSVTKTPAARAASAPKAPG